MISHISGTIIHKDLDHLIISANGIGYKVFTSNNTGADSIIDEHISLWTHDVVREQNRDLYGFISKNDLNFFELLINISGIGPKGALGILNTAPVEVIVEGVRRGDTTHLVKVAGIGKKSSEKIILELRDKLGKLETEETSMNIVDAIDSLVALGYSEKEARENVKKLDKELPAEELIKQSLKNLH
jgi:Holliday junction DNA helicase RuvA